MKTPKEVLELLAADVKTYRVVPERVTGLILQIERCAAAAIKHDYLNGDKGDMWCLLSELKTIIDHAANALSMLSETNDGG